MSIPSAEVQAQSSEQLASYYVQRRAGLGPGDIDAYTRNFIQQMLHVEAVLDTDTFNLVRCPDRAQEIFARIIKRQAHQDYQDRQVARQTGDESPHTTGEKYAQRAGPNEAQPPPSSSTSSSGPNTFGSALQQCLARLNQRSVQSQAQADTAIGPRPTPSPEQSRRDQTAAVSGAEDTSDDTTADQDTVSRSMREDAASDSSSDTSSDESEVAATTETEEPSKIDTTPFLYQNRCKTSYVSVRIDPS